tara:strand:+ start:230 stop:403 length:174 start_codon:yes stop_codon:yes gene_type:complete
MERVNVESVETDSTQMQSPKLPAVSLVEQESTVIKIFKFLKVRVKVVQPEDIRRPKA